MVKAYGATILNEREEIGLAMNFGKYPVLWMEVGKPRAGWDPFTLYEGCKALITCRTSRHGDLIYTGRLSMYGDEQKEEVLTSPWCWDGIHLSSDGSFLDASFGYSDVMEDLENAQSPMLETDQEVIVVMKDSENEKCWVRKMKTTSHKDPHCQTMLKIVNIKEDD